MKTTSKAMLLAALLAPAGARAQAPSADACGGLELENGAVVTGQPVAIEATMTESVAACVRAIGRTAASLPYIRGITVEARAHGAERGGGQALGAAQRAADVLVEQGLPRQRVSIVAPRIDAGEPTGLFFTYSEAPSEKPVALLEHAAGAVQAGRGEKLAPAQSGAKLPQFTTIRTADDGHATVLLADGSRLQLGPATAVRLNALGLNTALRPQVQLELLQGEVEVTAASGGEGSLFELAANGVSAQASGARFRLAIEGDQTRLEVLEGEVGFAGRQGQPKPNQAVAITRDGKALEVRAQLAPPEVVSPVLGTFRQPPALSWTAVEGARRYRVEIARDPAFRESMRWLTVDGTETDVAGLETGKWFWRVRAADAEGFIGLSSKFYAFTVDPDAPAETPITPATPKIDPIPEGSAPPKA